MDQSIENDGRVKRTGPMNDLIASISVSAHVLYRVVWAVAPT